MTRRVFLGAVGAASANALPLAGAQSAPEGPTRFQIGCMTMPYSAFPLQRALEGIAKAGCKYVGWGGAHMESGVRKPSLAVDAPADEASRLAARCRDLGLQPAMMFSGITVDAPDSVKGHTQRIRQAAAAKIPFIVTFGKTTRGNFEGWVRNLKELAPIAAQEGVQFALKPHAGNTGTGRDCVNIIAAVGSPAVKICYDSGNVLDYEKTDPLPDIRACWRDVGCFAIKDHRNIPKSQDCGPGLGEIDHYQLLTPVLRTGLAMPLICENIFAPLVPRPAEPEGVDKLVARAREFLETVITGLQAGA